MERTRGQLSDKLKLVNGVKEQNLPSYPDTDSFWLLFALSKSNIVRIRGIILSMKRFLLACILQSLLNNVEIMHFYLIHVFLQ